ncbi:MAG: hypothetical protein V4675_19285 [Verrucomicrobiota bacterium]
MRSFDLSSWQGILSSVLGLALFALIGVGIRVLLTMTIQQRRERANRQINERLKTLMSAYKVLGGSFTGDLTVDPTHLRDLRQRAVLTRVEEGGAMVREETVGLPDSGMKPPPSNAEEAGSVRARRIRDTVEAALSDILLLGTEAQVRLAAKAVVEMVEGRPIHTAELVVSLRAFIRKALDLDPIPDDVKVPLQGPTRPPASGGGGRGNHRGERGRESSQEGGRREGGKSGGGGGAAAAGGGLGMGLAAEKDDQHDASR